MRKLTYRYARYLLALLYLACNSNNQDRLESKKNIEIADKLIRENLQSPKELQKALYYLDKAIALDSTNVKAYQNKVTIFMMLKKETELIKPLLKLVELKPDFVESYITLGRTYERLENYDSANLIYKQARTNLLNKAPSDTRNSNLLLVEFLITKSKSATLEKLKEYGIQDPEIKRNLLLAIDELVGEPE